MTHPASTLRILLSVLAAAAILLGAPACRERSAPDNAPSADIDPNRTATAQRGPLKLTAELSTHTPTIGDRVILQVRFEVPAGTLIEFGDPDWPADVQAELDFERYPVPPRAADDATDIPPSLAASAEFDVATQRWTLSPLTIGECALPEYTAYYVLAPSASDAEATANSERQEITLQLPALTIASVLTDTASIDDPRDITAPYLPPAPPAPVDPAERRRLILILVGLLLAVIATVAALIWVARRPARVAPPVPPASIARSALDALERSDRVQYPDPRPFYDELTLIARRYIEQRFRLPATDMTTPEFLASASQPDSPLPAAATQALQQLLNSADLIKYAALVPDTNLRPADLAHVRTLIDQCEQHVAANPNTSAARPATTPTYTAQPATARRTSSDHIAREDAA